MVLNFTDKEMKRKRKENRTQVSANWIHSQVTAHLKQQPRHSRNILVFAYFYTCTYLHTFISTSEYLFVYKIRMTCAFMVRCVSVRVCVLVCVNIYREHALCLSSCLPSFFRFSYQKSYISFCCRRHRFRYFEWCPCQNLSSFFGPGKLEQSSSFFHRSGLL